MHDQQNLCQKLKKIARCKKFLWMMGDKFSRLRAEGPELWLLNLPKKERQQKDFASGGSGGLGSPDLENNTF